MVRKELPAIDQQGCSSVAVDMTVLLSFLKQNRIPQGTVSYIQTKSHNAAQQLTVRDEIFGVIFVLVSENEMWQNYYETNHPDPCSVPSLSFS